MKKVKSEKHTEKLPVYPSMSACAGATGIPLGIIKTAKRAGCEAFTDASRVKLEALLRWIFSDENDAAAVNWSAKLDEYRAKREALKLKREEGNSLDADEVRDAVASGVATLFAENERLFVNELPPALAGLDAVTIRQRSELASLEVKTAVREKLGALLQ